MLGRACCASHRRRLVTAAQKGACATGVLLGRLLELVACSSWWAQCVSAFTAGAWGGLRSEQESLCISPSVRVCTGFEQFWAGCSASCCCVSCGGVQVGWKRTVFARPFLKLRDLGVFLPGLGGRFRSCCGTSEAVLELLGCNVSYMHPSRLCHSIPQARMRPAAELQDVDACGSFRAGSSSVLEQAEGSRSVLLRRLGGARGGL